MEPGRRYYRREEDRGCDQSGCHSMAPSGRAQWDWLYVCDCIDMYSADAFLLCPEHAGEKVLCPACNAVMLHP